MKVLFSVFLLSATLMSQALAQNGNGQGDQNGQGYHGAPGPIAGAGLPFVAVGYGVFLAY
jgi:hypothetical protein